MNRVLLAGLGSFVGGMGRYLLTSWAQGLFGTAFPWGTAIVNISGCFLIGFAMTLAVELSALSTEARIFLVTGILGGLTTFSSFGYESVRPVLEGSAWVGVANIALNLIVGLLAVIAGILIARSVWS